MAEALPYKDSEFAEGALRGTRYFLFVVGAA
jgi:hypothetical protein